ncbi:MAG TPA: hypothetical protein DDZ80_08035 [Cyanobacteria bacterium UBA8803]|nr:hypothetical protein [Cyanobacteria bacterium UBA9273]HBL58453.1 hypothetical protein [Cyanobacteria bacterium UBA8803]
MNQVVYPRSAEASSLILCCYVNGTTKIMTARISNIPNWSFERVIFPKERLLFEAPPTAILEIHRNTGTGTTLSDKIPCNYLKVCQGSNQDQKMLAEKIA